MSKADTKIAIVYIAFTGFFAILALSMVLVALGRMGPVDLRDVLFITAPVLVQGIVIILSYWGFVRRGRLRTLSVSEAKVRDRFAKILVGAVYVMTIGLILLYSFDLLKFGVLKSVLAVVTSTFVALITGIFYSYFSTEEKRTGE